MTVKAGFLEALAEIGDVNPDLTYFLEGSYWELYGKLVDIDYAYSNLYDLLDQATDEDVNPSPLSRPIIGLLKVESC